MRVAVLVDRIHAVRTIRKAFGGTPVAARLLFLSSWRELVDGAGSESFDLAIVQPSFGVAPSLSSPNLTDLERFVSLFPTPSVILYLCRSDPAPTFLLDLARMEFPYLLLRGVDDDPRTVQRVVARAETRRILRLKLTALEDQLEEEAVRLLLNSATGWPPAKRVEDLASQQQMSDRTLQRRLRRGHLPTPGRLISYARFLEPGSCNGRVSWARTGV